MAVSTTSHLESRYDFPAAIFSGPEGPAAQTSALDRKCILNALGGSIWPTAQPTLNYRLKGTDTLDWGDQSVWAEIKWILSLLEERPGMKPFETYAMQYGTLLDIIVESQRTLRRSPLHQLEEIYSFRDAATVRRFLHTCPQLVEVLLEAHGYLQKYFGPDPQVTLEVVSDPEVKSMDELFAYILTSLPVDEALARLDRLDEEWFLDQFDRIDGQFNFNLEFA